MQLLPKRPDVPAPLAVALPRLPVQPVRVIVEAMIVEVPFFRVWGLGFRGLGFSV